jgi:hypothetical protein
VHRHVRQPQRTGDGLGHRREHLVGLARGHQAVAEAAQRCRGIVTVAVDELVDPPPQPPVQRLERDRHDPDGHDPRGRVVDQPAERRHHRHVEGDHDRRQRAVDQRAADHEVDVPQSVPQDGDRHPGRERDHRRRQHDVTRAPGRERERQQHGAERLGLERIGVVRCGQRQVVVHVRRERLAGRDKHDRRARRDCDRPPPRRRQPPVGQQQRQQRGMAQ